MPGMNLSAAFQPAIDHMVRVLFRPFAYKRWLALGFASALAYAVEEFSHNQNNGSNSRASGPSFNLNLGPFHWNGTPAWNFVPDWSHVIYYLPVIIPAALAAALILWWISSIMKFVYVNQLTGDPLAIREPFARFKDLGTSFFCWELVFVVATAAVATTIAALTAVAEYHDAIVSAFGMIGDIIIATIFLGIVLTFAHDFVIPVMYLRGVKVLAAWRIVLPMLQVNPGQTALYILVVIAVTILGSIAEVLSTVVVAIVLLIPGGLLFLVGYAIWLGAGQTWAPPLIAYAVCAGLLLAAAVLYGTSCITQPIQVFRRSFALVVLGQADPTLITIPIDHQTPRDSEQ